MKGRVRPLYTASETRMPSNSNLYAGSGEEGWNHDIRVVGSVVNTPRKSRLSLRLLMVIRPVGRDSYHSQDLKPLR